MKKLFEYNWQVRKEWLTWCESLSEQELLKRRVGGIGNILHTLLHIVDVEYSWVALLQGKPEPIEPSLLDYASLDKVKQLSDHYHPEVNHFVENWTSDLEWVLLEDVNAKGEQEIFYYGEVMRHVIAHEIHHIGQLSVWSREIERKPITANFIRRGLFDK
ncbi:DinB family protein [Virgibacillus salexigens]|uniref:DinB family protein n=1 Tax=Virgibacillus massiliensis TaxID=1462526 RepID=A0A024QH35_9BACI|nr:DinB family protein [Virgibacillus massiliensis]CDQ41276.1 DinB family protein [Virgibacillus massiliensis]